MQRMLVIRGGAVGDLIVTLPALGALRQAFPHATIELLGNPSRAVLAQHPRYVDRVIDLNTGSVPPFSQQPTLSQGLATFLSSFELMLSYLPVPDVIFTTNLRRYCQGKSSRGRHIRRQACILLTISCSPSHALAASHAMPAPTSIRTQRRKSSRRASGRLPVCQIRG